MPFRKGWSLHFRAVLLCSCLTVFTGAITVSAQSSKAPITLSVKDRSVKAVLQEIQRKTTYEFFYSDTEVDLNRHISVNLQGASLQEALQVVLGKQYNWRIEGKNVYIKALQPAKGSHNATVQEQQTDKQLVSGTVNTASGVPLVGVTIRVKGATTGVVTDANGHFQLYAGKGQQLEFSYIGYDSQRIKTDTVQGPLQVALSETPRSLNQVVVTGYSNKRMGELTGAVSQVKSEELQTTTTQSIFDNLQGKVAGMNVSIGGGNSGGNSQATIVIRGRGSMGNNTTQPLVVIDGIIQDYAATTDPFSNISPSDIASVTVLRDAASAALYGARAANGVLVITTKRGAAGRTKVGANVTYGANKASLGKFRMMDSQQRFDLQQQIYRNQYLDANPGATDAAVNDYVHKMVPDSVLKYNTNWNDLMLRTGQTQDYNVWMAGGEQRIKYYASGDYFREIAPLVTDNYRRYNFRFNVDFQATERMFISSSANISYSSLTNGGFYTPYSSAFSMMPWDSPYNADGSKRIGGPKEKGWYSGSNFNPLYGKDYDDGTMKSTSGGFDLNLRYRLTDWLTFNTRNRYSFINGERQFYIDPRDPTSSYYARGGLLSMAPANNSNIITTEMLQVDKAFNRHHIAGLAAFEYNTVTQKNTSVSVYGLKPGIRSINAGDPTTMNFRNTFAQTAYLSLFSELNYSYDDKYFATASFRRDGSSKFGQNNKYGNFYAFSAAWQLNKERFLLNAKNLDLLKLRFSYGVSGNDLPLSAYQYLSLYGFVPASDQYDRQSGTIQDVQGNPDLHWEMQYTTNVGIDAGFWDRLNLSVELYNKVNKGLLLLITPPATNGGNTYYQNMGRIRNQGIEVTINTRQLKNTAVKWSTDLTFAYNNNKVLELQPGTNLVYNGQYSGTARIVGSPMNSYYMPVYAGVDPVTGASRFEVLEKDANGNYTGKVNYTDNPGNATLQVLGNTNPKYIAGMTNNVSYKNFSLSVMLTYFGGLKMLNRTRANLDLDGSNVQANNAAPASGQIRWQHPGDNADLPKAGTKIDSYFPTSRYVEDGSFLRLKNVRLGYSFSDKLVKKLGVGKVNVFVSGDNMVTWTKFTGMDPENTYAEENAGKVPFTKRFLGGIQVTF
ncbi:SusC/RagA family TonB-linked outer membrane protein [Chitinophaga qingshengii]|uniref:SusC/RagA family TonB-linked outer membrane protein n=1 Tax=Chitinophaga qingshengii TaxID=1569794 RepID=A0ABR7TXS9_9BACT|nr:SusC/RagA family TonB-linked outer membrane protein [Chitinophaga qingshengii]MBC9934540.1 SusC/RagA family TonB-linked outer membrane protein [Chitinophaga qingshengii]